MAAVEFMGAYPIGNTDTRSIPVKHLGPACAFYSKVLGFEVAEKADASATLRRGCAEIGLSENGTDPEQASVYFEVSDPLALREELLATGIDPSELRTDTHNGARYLVFFAREPYGVCFCFGKKQE